MCRQGRTVVSRGSAMQMTHLAGGVKGVQGGGRGGRGREGVQAQGDARRGKGVGGGGGWEGV